MTQKYRPLRGMRRELLIATSTKIAFAWAVRMLAALELNRRWASYTTRYIHMPILCHIDMLSGLCFFSFFSFFFLTGTLSALIQRETTRPAPVLTHSDTHKALALLEREGHELLACLLCDLPTARHQCRKEHVYKIATPLSFPGGPAIFQRTNQLEGAKLF